jgi:hypothetical protein
MVMISDIINMMIMIIMIMMILMMIMMQLFQLRWNNFSRNCEQTVWVLLEHPINERRKCG